MPINPSPNLMQRLLPNQKMTAPIPSQGPLTPSWLRQGFEGASDAVLGALGIGPDTTMNRVGAMIPAAAGVAGMTNRMMSGMRGIPTPTAEPTIAGPTANFHAWQLDDTMPEGGFPMYNISGGPSDRSTVSAETLQKMGIKLPQTPPMPVSLMDDAGRHIGTEPQVDPVFAAHVASSRNKHVLPTKGAGHSNLAPSSDTLERMMARYRK